MLTIDPFEGQNLLVTDQQQFPPKPSFINQTDIELSIVMPCLNEAETLELCIRKAQNFLRDNLVRGEIIIADNGSTDGSQDIARQLGVRVIDVKVKGYGAALMGGISAASGRYIIMGDSDDSYDFSDLSLFLEKLREGYDLVMGNRFQGGIESNAMPFLHRYIGNPLLSGIGRLFFHAQVNDFHCGLRGFRKVFVEQLNLQTTGMEFASEMVIKATLSGQRICEVPTKLMPDGRSRAPHLRTWRDGWRHLRFMLLHCPNWLFLAPGIFLLGLGLVLMTVLTFGSVQIGKFLFDIHHMILGSALVLLGNQVISLDIFTKVYFSMSGHYARKDKFLQWFNLEQFIILGSVAFFVGLLIDIGVLYDWLNNGFGVHTQLRATIIALTLTVFGAQIVFSSFYIGILSLLEKPTNDGN